MLKLNIGFSRKMGEANYGSRGASVNLEIEVESGLVREPDKLQAKIDYMFDLAKSSVDSQLNGNGNTDQPASANARNRIGHGSHGNSNGRGSDKGSQGSAGSNGNSGHRASEKQVNFINQLARSIRGLGVRRLAGHNVRRV